jgi:hypothetical protein
MTIVRTIPTRTAEAVWKIACASPDHVEHAGGRGVESDSDFKPPRIFMGAFLDDGELPLSPPQIHIYHPIAGRREIGTSGIDNRDFDIEVEYFFPRNCGGAMSPGENHLVDWMEALVNAVIRGATPQRPAGKLADPDYPATATQVPMVTTGIGEVLYHPIVARNDSLVAYVTITFTTKEDTAGRRPYQ